MYDVYSISDRQIFQLIGEKVRSSRLAQNITQAGVAEDAEVPITIIRRIERGEIGSMGSLLRVIRVLGMVDVARVMLYGVPIRALQWDSSSQ